MSKNLSELSFRKGIEENLFEAMGIAARKEGSPDKDDLDRLALEFLTGQSNVYGAASFYDFLKEDNKGKQVYVCNGTACVCAGKQGHVQDALQQQFKAEQIGHMTCLGRCHENAAFHYQGRNYSGSAFQHLDTVVDRSNHGHDTYQVGHLGPALLTAPSSGLETIHSVLKTTLSQGREWALGEIKTSQIRGRGGAGFPMGFKLESCQQARSDIKFIVCNADEGDPGAYSDRYLLEQQPHSVILGMMVAGFITGAKWGVFYIRAEYPEAAIRSRRLSTNCAKRGISEGKFWEAIFLLISK